LAEKECRPQMPMLLGDILDYEKNGRSSTSYQDRTKILPAVSVWWAAGGRAGVL
jgi:hypothetical protein